MAKFEGTITEFTKFIGAYARIKVMHLAAKHKRSTGKCEQCGSQTKTLEAAHVQGMERPLIISNILSEFIEGDVVKIDLQEFEERFIKAHDPIEKTIKILCKECHRNYDRKKAIHEFIPETTDVRNVSEVVKYAEKENKAIEEMVNRHLNKGKSLEIINEKINQRLNSPNTIFSNIISIDDVWWLQPHNSKFQNDLNIILNDYKTQTLFLLRLPANTITNASDHFKQRNDKFRTNCSDIYIPLWGFKFVYKNGFDFTPYLTGKIHY